MEGDRGQCSRVESKDDQCSRPCPHSTSPTSQLKARAGAGEERVRMSSPGDHVRQGPFHGPQLFWWMMMSTPGSATLPDMGLPASWPCRKNNIFFTYKYIHLFRFHISLASITKKHSFWAKYLKQWFSKTTFHHFLNRYRVLSSCHRDSLNIGSEEVIKI